jgi:hypothetical protein
VKKSTFVFALAVLALTACSGDGGGGGSLDGLRPIGQAVEPTAPPQTELQAPPAPTSVPVVIKETVVVERQVVETVIVEMPVVATPTPDLAPTCPDPRTPMPTIGLDQQDIDTGVVLRGQWCQP